MKSYTYSESRVSRIIITLVVALIVGYLLTTYLVDRFVIGFGIAFLVGMVRESVFGDKVTIIFYTDRMMIADRNGVVLDEMLEKLEIFWNGSNSIVVQPKASSSVKSRKFEIKTFPTNSMLLVQISQLLGIRKD